MEWIPDFFEAISIPTILILAGLFFILLGFVNKIGGVVEVKPNRSRSAIFIGILLLTTGLTLSSSTLFAPPNDAVADKNLSPSDTEQPTSPSPFQKELIPPPEPSIIPERPELRSGLIPHELPSDSQEQLPEPLPEPSIIPDQQELRLEPAQFVSNYYASINQRKLDEAWNMLTPQFQEQEHTSGYSEYSDWWNSVDQVHVHGIPKTLELDTSTDIAQVEVSTGYIRDKNYIPEKLQILTLTWNNNISNWQISEREKV